MYRREFLHTTAGALAAAGAQAQTPDPAAARKANLKLGTQHGDSDGILKVNTTPPCPSRKAFAAFTACSAASTG